MRNTFNILSILACCALTTNVSAHSEHDKARFVASEGKDVGLCDNVLRPCKTIEYAVKQANKGDRVLVSSGHYSISSTEELFYLKSSLIPIVGGYNRFDHFQSQSPDSNITTLSNIPTSMTSQLRKLGFNVIADGKSFAKDKKFQAQLEDFEKLSQRQSESECIGGKASGFDCENINLLAHIPLNDFSSRPNSGSDIWGHVDLNTGHEYAIMTVNNGVAVFNVSSPTKPTEVGTIPGVNSGWRDVKVYQYFDSTINLWQAYAYVTTEGSNNGATDYVTVIDLNNLPHSVNLIEKNRVVSTAHNVYISNVDHSLNIALPNKVPSLQLVGANSRQGAFQSYSLENPETLPAASGNYFGNGYTHDGASMSITDQRAINDCNESSSECTVFIDFNETEMKLWNISDPKNASLLSTAEYFDVSKSQQYVHSGWGTEDQQYILLHDEFDEYRGGLNTTIRIFSIADLKSPVQVGQWTGPTTAIDHNGFVRGNRYYMSNYTRGLTILDISDPSTPKQVGYFDTFPTNDNPSFHGAWGVYPFLPSGNIIVSDIDSGLYILGDNTKDSVNGVLGFNSNSVTTAQGTELNVSVQRLNTQQGAQAISVQYQVISGSAKQGEDFVVSDGTLNWSAGDNSDKTINVSIAADESGQETPESFFVRLYNPTNGVVLNKNSYITVNIEGIVDRGSASFEMSELVVAENQSTLTINVNRAGSSTGEVSFDYITKSGDAIVGDDIEENSGRLTWSDSDSAPKQITINIVNDDNEEGDESFEIELISVDGSRLGSNSTIEITISDDDTNTAPTVEVNENFEVNTTQIVTLTATANDAESDELTYLWTETSNQNITLDNADTLSASFTAPSSATTLTFEFTATDTKGAATSQTISVSVVAPTEVITVTPTKKSSGGGSAHYLLLLVLLTVIRKRMTTR